MHVLNSVFITFILVLTAQTSIAAMDPLLPLTNPGIKVTKARTIYCPEKLDTSNIKSEKGWVDYLLRESMSELPYREMKGSMVKVVARIPIGEDSVQLTSVGGAFVINNDGNSVSKMACQYLDTK